MLAVSWVRPDFSYTTTWPTNHPVPQCWNWREGAGEAGGALPAVLNTAIEAAVSVFLDRKSTFAQISDVVARLMDDHTVVTRPDLKQIIAADSWARQEAME